MAITTIIVHKNGRVVGSGYQVSISGKNLFAGVSDKVRTNRDGIAQIEHSWRGKAKIYVNGKHIETATVPAKVCIYL